MVYGLETIKSLHKVNGPITNRDLIRPGPTNNRVPITDRNAFWGHFSLRSPAKNVDTWKSHIKPVAIATVIITTVDIATVTMATVIIATVTIIVTIATVIVETVTITRITKANVTIATVIIANVIIATVIVIVVIIATVDLLTIGVTDRPCPQRQKYLNILIKKGFD